MMEEPTENANPYQTPNSELQERSISDRIGGNVEDALAGRYHFLVGEVISEAWQKTKGAKRVFWSAGIVVLLAMMIFGAGLAVLLPGAFAADSVGIGVRIFVQLLATAVVYPFLVGFLMLGIRRAANLPISFANAFGYFHVVLAVIVAALLISVLTSLGLMLFILPGIYLSIAYTFTLPLIAEKDFGPWQAMETSRRAVTRHWFAVFATVVVMWIILFLSMFTIIGIIWTVPMMLISIGIMYREIFGIEAPTVSAQV